MEPDQIQRMATRFHADIKAASDRATQEAAAMARWTIATLVLVNGGGAIAVVGVDEIDPSCAIVSAGAFVAGVVLALGAGNASAQNFNRRMAPALGNWLGYWAAVADGALRDENLEKELKSAVDRSLDPPWVVRLSRLSALAFVIASIFAGLGVALARI